MAAQTVALFRNNKSQAVRIPKDMEFEGINAVEILRIGDSVILRPPRPKKRGWLSLLKTPGCPEFEASTAFDDVGARFREDLEKDGLL